MSEHAYGTRLCCGRIFGPLCGLHPTRDRMNRLVCMYCYQPLQKCGLR